MIIVGVYGLIFVLVFFYNFNEIFVLKVNKKVLLKGFGIWIE